MHNRKGLKNNKNLKFEESWYGDVVVPKISIQTHKRSNRIGKILGISIVFIMFLSLILISPRTIALTDVKIDPDVSTVVQNEISLTLIPSATPGQPTVLLAAYNNNPYSGGNGIGYSYSTDGGTIWTNGQMAFPTNPFTLLPMDQEFDPTATSDTQGNLYIGYIATDVVGYSGLYVSNSTDLGVSWSSPVTVAIDFSSGWLS